MLKDNIYRNNKTNIFSTKLLTKLQWKDSKTIKKHLYILKDLGYIHFEFEGDKIPHKQPMQIEMREMEEKEYYTFITSKAIHSIIECSGESKEMSIRLYLYYLKNYHIKNKYAFPSYDEISYDLKMSSKSTKAINNNLMKHKILYVDIGDQYVNQYSMTVRERNKYYPLQ